MQWTDWTNTHLGRIPTSAFLHRLLDLPAGPAARAPARAPGRRCVHGAPGRGRNRGPVRAQLHTATACRALLGAAEEALAAEELEVDLSVG